MNALLEEKINKLEEAQDKECWYLVKHSTDFSVLCYLVLALEKWQKNKVGGSNVQSSIESQIADINQAKGLDISNNYRALRVACFFGLLRMKSTSYNDAEMTEVFYEITDLCHGCYENKESYNHVVQRQIEKMFISSSIDEECCGVRKNYRLYPIILLYKILLEVGFSTGKFEITMNEYRYFVATTEKFRDFLDTLLYIKLSRYENNINDLLQQYFSKFDNRMIQALKQLDALDITNDSLKLKQEYISMISEKVYTFEQNSLIFETDDYINFLCSAKALFDVYKEQHANEIKNDLDEFSPEWFNRKGKEFSAEDVNASSLYKEFIKKYSIAALKNLSGEELLKTMFLGTGDDSLCHELEYVNNDLFGSVKGGNSYKYPLFYNKGLATWMKGTRKNPIRLSLDDAIAEGITVRDGLEKGVGIIAGKTSIDSVDDYLSLYTELHKEIPDLVDSMWVYKYFHMLFPQLFPVFYSKDWQVKVLDMLKLVPSDTTYGRFGQISRFVKECGISNVVFSKVFHQYCKDTYARTEVEKEYIDDSSRLVGATNILLYGVPGAGKSHTVEKEYGQDKKRVERVIFHPDYTYSDFVGQILPRSNEDKRIEYEFIPGVFTKILKAAYDDPGYKYYLIIEEINRGNAPAIFGEVFQLLDRVTKKESADSNGTKKEGESCYEISNSDIAKIVYADENVKVKLPSNLYVIATMNTSDQNVFTLDTAFQRRWNMQMVENNIASAPHANKGILDTAVTWKRFCEVLNRQILDTNKGISSSEDKRLGAFFVVEEDLETSNTNTNNRFSEKVIKYLWDDAFKFARTRLFREDLKCLEDVIKAFNTSQFFERFVAIFNSDVVTELRPAADNT